MKDTCFAGKAGTTGTKQAWSYLVESNLVKDNDYKGPSLSQGSIVTAGALNLQKVFSPTVATFSLPPEDLEEFGDPRWGASTAEAWREQGLITDAWVSVGGDPLRLTNSWLSLLFVPGQIVQKVGEKSQAWFVVHSCSSCAVLLRMWPRRSKMAGEEKFLTWLQFSPPAGAPPQYRVVVVEDHSLYVSAPATALPALELQRRKVSRDVGIFPEGLAVVPGKFSPVLVSAGRLAFPGMTVPFLKLLHKHVITDGAGRVPSTELGLLTALVHHVVDGFETEARIKEIVSLRSKAADEQAIRNDSTLLVGENMKLAGGMLDEKELDQATKWKRRITELKGGGSGSAASSGDASKVAASSSSSSSSGGLGRLRAPTKIVVNDPTDVNAWRAFVPQAKGCSLTVDLLWHNRWCITYRNEKPPTVIRVASRAAQGTPFAARC